MLQEQPSIAFTWSLRTGNRRTPLIRGKDTASIIARTKAAFLNFEYDEIKVHERYYVMFQSTLISFHSANVICNTWGEPCVCTMFEKKYMDNVRQEANIATGGVISCVHNTEKHILICFANWTLIQFCIASLIFGDA